MEPAFTDIVLFGRVWDFIKAAIKEFTKMFSPYKDDM
jgi:hypothetical protein